MTPLGPASPPTTEALAAWADALEDLWQARTIAGGAPPRGPDARSAAGGGGVATARLAAVLGLQADLSSALAGAGQALAPLPPPFEGLRAAALRHPLAAQELIATLAAEGDRFADTTEGAALADRLRHSAPAQDLLQRFADSTGRVFSSDEEALPARWLEVLLGAAGTGP